MDCLETFHSGGYIHRDVKPDNYMIGRGANANRLYVIDYGLSKRYVDDKKKQHIAFRENKRLTGTAKFCSLNTHLGYEQSRRDDLEALGYSLIYLLRGRLPWQDVKASSKGKRYDEIMDSKNDIPLERLCKGLPPEMLHYMTYVRGLQFDFKPDYAQLRKLFAEAFSRAWGRKAFISDWVKAKVNLEDHPKRPQKEEHQADANINLADAKLPSEAEKIAARKLEVMNLLAGVPKNINLLKPRVAAQPKRSSPNVCMTKLRDEGNKRTQFLQVPVVYEEDEKDVRSPTRAHMWNSKTPTHKANKDMVVDKDAGGDQCDFGFNDIMEHTTLLGTFLASLSGIEDECSIPSEREETRIQLPICTVIHESKHGAARQQPKTPKPTHCGDRIIRKAQGQGSEVKEHLAVPQSVLRQNQQKAWSADSRFAISG